MGHDLCTEETVRAPSLVVMGFVSHRTQELGIMGLMRLFFQAYSNNLSNGITGVLFYDGRKFGQIMEGERAAIDDRWDQIRRDARHRRVFLLGKKTIMSRNYENWSMYVKDGSAISLVLPQFSGLIADNRNSSAQEVLRIMQSYGMLKRRPGFDTDTQKKIIH